MPRTAQLIRLRWFDSTVAPATAVYTPEEALAEKLVILGKSAEEWTGTLRDAAALLEAAKKGK